MEAAGCGAGGPQQRPAAEAGSRSAAPKLDIPGALACEDAREHGAISEASGAALLHALIKTLFMRGSFRDGLR